MNTGSKLLERPRFALYSNIDVAQLTYKDRYSFAPVSSAEFEQRQRECRTVLGTPGLEFRVGSQSCPS